MPIRAKGSVSTGAQHATAAMRGLTFKECLLCQRKTAQFPPEIYQLKVILLGTSPPIWRRLLVPADLTLAQLHDVLQCGRPLL